MRCLLGILASITAFCAIAGPNDTVTGHFRGFDPSSSGFVDYNFSCSGTPTCTGVASGTMQDGGCLNSSPVPPEQIVIQGLDLSKPGTVNVSVTLANDYRDNQPNPANPIVCTYSPRGTAFAVSFSGSWNGSTGTFSGPLVVTMPSDGTAGIVTGNFTASLATAASPVFPMTVTSNVTATTVSASAAIQPRPQDVGTSASVFVFAQAPSSLVSGASHAKRVESPGAAAATKDDAIVCVLAQVSPTGQLVAVSASTMQAYVTSVLGSQSQAVQVLNNVPTPNVAGASLFVGYGSSAAAMLSSGVFQTALSVPGPIQCTASLASAPAPTLPGAITGLWWNSNESGWGIHFTQRESNIFAAWYTYDAAGNPKWYVVPNCAGMTGTSGSCTGSLYEVNGPTFFGASFVPISSSQVTAAGTIHLTFTDANNGSMNYTVGSNTRTVSIARQPVGVGTITPAIDYSDLWWNPNESGWGMAMAQQNANIFLAWYVYDNTGKPVWYVASNCTVSGSSCSGPLYSTAGPPFGPTFDSGQIKVATAGSVIVSFIDANNAVLTYTVGTVTATKTITRQLF